MKTLIKNGLVVLEDGPVSADLLIDGETIAAIGKADEICGAGKEEAAADCRVIDASGLIVLPGGIDPHTHFNIMTSVRSVDDFTSGTVSAVFGGTTTIVDHMGFGPKGCDLHHQFQVYKEYTDGKCVADYGFHGVYQDLDEQILEETASMVDEGLSSFKMYLTYDYRQSDEEAIRILKRLGELGGMTAMAAGDQPLYIVHVSAGESAERIRQARQAGQKVFGETCTQYLVLDDSVYDDPQEGLKFIMSPPIRGKEHQEILWQALRDGTLLVVATDHCSFDYHGDKQMGKEDFTKCPNGAPGAELRMPILFSEGVSKGRLDLTTFAKVTSTNAAKLFGMYPKKGTIRVGSDADLVLFDPEREVDITRLILHDNTDYTPYEGMHVKGWPILTMIRGTVVVENERLQVKPGFGNFLRRGKSICDL